MKDDERKQSEDTNHPAAFLGGGAAGAIAGATVGAIAGPLGAAAGAVVGGLGGAMTGEAIADDMPQDEENYWREQFDSRPEKADTSFDAVRPAYKSGYVGAMRYGDQGAPFNEVEDRIREDYQNEHSELDWGSARDAARDAYDRTIVLREERLRPQKERVQTGEVELRKEVISETQTIEVPIQREEIVIERRAADGTSTSGEIGAEEVIRVPVSEERVTLEKEVINKEEIRVEKRLVEDTATVSGTIRKEELATNSSGDSKVIDNTGRNR